MTSVIARDASSFPVNSIEHYKSLPKSNKLSDYQTYDAKSQLLFSVPEKGSFEEMGDNGEKGQTIKYHKIHIRTLNNEDDYDNTKTVGDLVINTPPRLFSFGVNKNMMKGAVNGYTFPLCLFSRGGATPEEQRFVKVIEEIVDVCKHYLVNVRDEIDQYSLELRDLEKVKGGKKGISPLYYKYEIGVDPATGKKKPPTIVPGTGPTLYAKLMYSSKKDKIATKFRSATEVDDEGNLLRLDPLDLISTETDRKYFYAEGALKFESIFIGTNIISIQLKLAEANITPSVMGGTSYLRTTMPVVPQKRPNVVDNEPIKSFTASESTANPLQMNDDNLDETSSILSDDDLVITQPVVTASKKALPAKKVTDVAKPPPKRNVKYATEK